MKQIKFYKELDIGKYAFALEFNLANELWWTTRHTGERVKYLVSLHVVEAPDVHAKIVNLVILGLKLSFGVGKYD